MGRQWNTIIESLGPLTGGSMSISANLTDIEALLTTLQADVADGIIVTSGTVLSNLRDGSGNAITSTTSGTSRRLDVTPNGVWDDNIPPSVRATGDGTPIYGVGIAYGGVDGAVVVSETQGLPISGTVNSNVSDGSGNAITSTSISGKRRLDVTLAGGGTVGSASPSFADLVAGTDGTNLRALSTDTSGRLNTNINGTVPVSGTVTINNQSLYSSGALTLSGTSALNTDLIPSTDVTAYQEVLVQVTGTWPTGATIQHQVSNDNVNFGSIVASNANALSAGLSTTITATGSYKVLLSGFAYYRLRVTQAGSAGTYSYAYTLNPRSSVFNTSVSVSSAPTTAVQIQASATTGGATTYHTLISAASTNATLVKSSNAGLVSIVLSNTTLFLRYFKIFNLTTAPTVGTSTPIFNHAIPPNSTINIDCGYAGIRLTTGFSYAITAGQALLDNTAVGAGDVVVNVAYT